jgi:hypothetical protein
MSFTSIITSISDDKKNIKGQDDLIGGSFPVFKLFKEQFEVTDTVVIQTRNIGGDVGIYGNEAFGIYGTAKYGSTADQSFILGKSILGLNKLGSQTSEFSIVRVVNGGNRFVEQFHANTFINTTNTTATLNTNEGTVTFT